MYEGYQVVQYALLPVPFARIPARTTVPATATGKQAAGPRRAADVCQAVCKSLSSRMPPKKTAKGKGKGDVSLKLLQADTLPEPGTQLPLYDTPNQSTPCATLPAFSDDFLGTMLAD